MHPKALHASLLLVLAIAPAAAIALSPRPAFRAEIVNKSIAARAAWRHGVLCRPVDDGKMDAGGNGGKRCRCQQQVCAGTPSVPDQVQLPFVMELKRSRKVRVDFNSRPDRDPGLRRREWLEVEALPQPARSGTVFAG